MKHIEPNLLEQSKIAAGESLSVRQRAMTLLDEFEKNVEAFIRSLEDCIIKKIEPWFTEIKQIDPRLIPQETRYLLCSIAPSFCPTDGKAAKNNPIADFFPDILRYLTQYIPRFKDEIKIQYNDLKTQIVKIVCTCGEDPLSPPSKLVLPYAEMSYLKGSIEKLIKDLRFCVKTAREQQQPQGKVNTDREQGPKESTTREDLTTKTKTFEKPTKKPSQPQLTAWKSYQWVLKKRPDLFELTQKKNDADKSKSKPRWYSIKMYEYMKENSPFYDNHLKSPTPIVGYRSWGRSLRAYEEWRQNCEDSKPEDSDQPATAVRREDVQDEDLSKLSVRFDIDN